MNKRADLFFFIPQAIVLVAFKLFESQMPDQLVLLFLKFTNGVVEFLLGVPSAWVPEKGFYFTPFNVLLNKSCSGFSFWVICALLITFIVVRHSQLKLIKTAALVFALPLSFIVANVVNGFRIYISIAFQRSGFSMPIKEVFLHDLIGICLNLTFLIILFTLSEFYLKYKRGHAKTA